MPRIPFHPMKRLLEACRRPGATRARRVKPAKTPAKNLNKCPERRHRHSAFLELP
jgi:hypothetical protein